jgi:di/tricarboxylate transporter
MRPGGYKTIDFIKAGSGMALMYLIIQVGMVSIFYNG